MTYIDTDRVYILRPSFATNSLYLWSVGDPSDPMSFVPIVWSEGSTSALLKLRRRDGDTVHSRDVVLRNLHARQFLEWTRTMHFRFDIRPDSDTATVLVQDREFGKPIATLDLEDVCHVL